MRTWLGLAAVSLAGSLFAAPADDYNQGVEAYRRGEFPTAEKSFENAARDEKLKDRALYNLGNARARQGRLEEAVKAYQDALHLNPDEKRIRENLEWAEKLKQEPPPQNQQGKDEQKSSPSENEKQDGSSSQEPPAKPDQSESAKPGDAQKEENKQTEENKQASSTESKGQEKPQEKGQAQSAEKQGPMSREEAERMIDAVPDRPGVSSDRQKERKRGRSKMDW